MKRFLISALLLTLSGCYQVVNNYDLAEAQTLCASRRGIAEISADFFGTEVVTCKNNKRFRLHQGETT